MKKTGLKSLNAASDLPKYIQLRDMLEDCIRNGGYNVGDKLCTEAVLKRRYNFSAATVTRALAELERKGLVTRKKGAGTFVAARYTTPDTRNDSGYILLIAGMHAAVDIKRTDVNWFITHELYRGLINSHAGRALLPEYAELKHQLTGHAQGACGVALVRPPTEIIREVAVLNMPYVVLLPEGIAGVPPVNTITVDRLRGVYDGMVYLIDQLGHRDIALIIPDMAKPGVGRHRDRIAGYSIGLHAFNIPYREELVAHASGGQVADGYAAMRELLERRVKFSAVFVDTDLKALGAIEALQEAGRRVPEDVSVLGFDDVPGVEQAEPPLTTVRVPRYEMGVAAVAMLDKRMAGGGDLPGVVLDSSLIKRATCGPAPVNY